jgi:hypothetical protein
VTAALDHLATAEAALAALRAELTRSPAQAATTTPEAAPEPPRGLANPAAFFAYVRARPPLGPTLSQEEVDGCTRILGACASERFPVAWVAYVLATAVHETAGALQPVREYGKGAGRPYGKPGRNGGQVAYGRGDVQLTWDENYERADRELALGGRLVANYDLALDPAISARIIVRGMREGWFTGKGLAAYLPATATSGQFENARRIVNGTDRAALIAGYAITFQAALQAGGWR